MAGKKARCMIVCAGANKVTEITVCVDREKGTLSKKERTTSGCAKSTFDR